MKSVWHLVRWLQPRRDLPASAASPPLSVQGSLQVSPHDPQNPEEFQRLISRHDREMAMIQDIVASLRADRSPLSPPAAVEPPESASR
jgi:hypothetical protein